MKLNFNNEEAKNIAMEIAKQSQSGYFEQNQVHMPEDAFMLLINKIGKKDLDNLCEMIKNHCPELTIEECYRLTQGELNLINNSQEMVKKIIYNCAMECLKGGMHLGNKTIADGKINTSSYLSHSLYEAELASNLAKIIGVDSNKAKTLAILHDYGRKITHTFEHVPRGFEELVKLGWRDEAVATLTHSFLNGGRCANCDPAEEGFYLDQEGNPKWENDEQKDDVTLFLEGYNYSIYDEILNIADLMATDRGIVSPQDRVSDIRTRKKADEKNEGYFLAEFTNKLNKILGQIGVNTEIQSIVATENIEEIKEKFSIISAKFFEIYKQKEQQR